MNRSLLFTVARVIIAGLLVWAFLRPSYNGWIGFQIPICAIMVWGVYRAFQEEDWSLLFFYGLLAVVFVPTAAMPFSRGVWRAIDLAGAILLPLSILLIDSAPFDQLLRRPSARRLSLVVSTVFAIAWMALGSAVIYYSGAKVISIVKLKLDRKEAQAQITRVKHDLYRTTDSDNNTETYDIYKTDYTFQTEDGRTINGSAELFDNPVSAIISDELLQRYRHGFEVSQDSAALLSVEYQAGNPGNNRALDHREGFFGTIFGSFFISLLSLMPLGIGYFWAQDNIRSLLPEKRAQQSAPKPSVKRSKSR
jgi:hypothetical protein